MFICYLGLHYFGWNLEKTLAGNNEDIIRQWLESKPQDEQDQLYQEFLKWNTTCGVPG